MKKIFVLGTVFLLAFVLSGCDVLPDDIIDKITEYEGVEERLLVDEVMAFVKDLEDTTKSNAAVCDTWYDGVDDDCDGIVEDTRTRFKAGADLSKKVNIIDDDNDGDSVLNAEVSYEFRGHVTVLKIMLDVDQSGDAIKVMIKESEIVFTPNEEVGMQLEQFIDDVSNAMQKDRPACQVWPIADGEDNDCNLTISLNDPIKLKFVLKTITPSGDDVNNPMNEAIFKSEHNGHVTVLKVIFTEDDSTEKRMIRIADLQQDVQVTFEAKSETEMLLNKLLDDLMNPELDEEAVCKLWTGNGVDDDCNLSISLNDPIKLKFVLKTITPNGDDEDGNPIYQATFNNDKDGHVTVLKVSFTEDDSNTELKILIRDISVLQPEHYYLNSDETIKAFQLFLDDYTNPDITFTKLSDEYFDGMLTQAYRIGRDAKIGDYATVSIASDVKQPDEENYFTLHVEFKEEKTTSHVMIRVKYIRKEVQNMKNKMMLDEGVDNDCNLACTEDDEAMKLYQRYLEVYTDKAISNDIMSQYFDKNPSSMYNAKREKFLASGASIALVDAIGPLTDGTYIMIYDVMKGDEKMRHHEPVKIGLGIDKSTPMLFALDDDDDGDGIPTDMKLMILEKYKNDLNDTSMDADKVCLSYTGGPVGNSCCPSCINTPNDYRVISIELFDEGAFSYIIVKHQPNDMTGEKKEIIEKYMIFFYQEEEGSLLFKLILSETFNDSDTLEIAVKRFLVEMNDTSKSIDEICMGVSKESFDTCSNMRNSSIGNFAVIGLTDFVSLDDEYMITVEYKAEGAVIQKKYYVSFVDQEGAIKQLLSIREVSQK